MSNKDLTIHLLIKSVRVPVTSQKPVIVIWSRQSKQAKTKKRLLTDQIDIANFNETFQISTTMPCDEDGNATKAKMVSRNFCLVSLANSSICFDSPNLQSLVTKLRVFSANVTSIWLSSATTSSKCRKSRFGSASMRGPGSR